MPIADLFSSNCALLLKHHCSSGDIARHLNKATQAHPTGEFYMLTFNINSPMTASDLRSLELMLMKYGNSKSIKTIVELNGLCTALISSSVIVPPSKWIPLIFANQQPAFQSANDLQSFITNLTKYYNEIANELLTETNHFKPLLSYTSNTGDKIFAAKDWARAYIHTWTQTNGDIAYADLEIRRSLEHISDLLSEKTCAKLESLPAEEYELAYQALVKDIVIIYITGRKWAIKQIDMMNNHMEDSFTTTQAKSNKVGRNDPCPCGSGKKYKKCCMLKDR